MTPFFLWLKAECTPSQVYLSLPLQYQCRLALHCTHLHANVSRFHWRPAPSQRGQRGRQSEALGWDYGDCSFPACRHVWLSLCLAFPGASSVVATQKHAVVYLPSYHSAHRQQRARPNLSDSRVGVNLQNCSLPRAPPCALHIVGFLCAFGHLQRNLTSGALKTQYRPR